MMGFYSTKYTIHSGSGNFKFYKIITKRHKQHDPSIDIMLQTSYIYKHKEFQETIPTLKASIVTKGCYNHSESQV